MRRYQLTDGQLRGLATGVCDPSTMGELLSSQRSKHLQLFSLLAHKLAHNDTHAPAIEVIRAAERLAPEAVRDVLAEPWTGVWLARSMRNLDHGTKLTRNSLGMEYLNAIAVVAASRTGLDVDLRVPARHSRIHLPTLGATATHTADSALVRVRGGVVTIDMGNGTTMLPTHPDQDEAGWLGRRTLNVIHNGAPLTVSIEDLDPYRHCYRRATSGRLTTSDIQAWHTLLQGAWALLVRHCPEFATEVADGWRCFVPLADFAGKPGLSATCRDAFGAFALTRPTSSVELMTTIVHEFRHLKLNALLELFPLCQRSEGYLYYAPWRSDPRPIRGLLHGAYAFLGVADAHLRLRQVPELRPQADRGVAFIRAQVRTALDGLDQSPELTAIGQRFVSGLRESLESMMDVQLPADLVKAAENQLALDHEQWQRVNAELLHTVPTVKAMPARA